MKPGWNSVGLATEATFPSSTYCQRPQTWSLWKITAIVERHLPGVILSVNLLHEWKCDIYSSPKGQSALSSLWARGCIYSLPSGWADVLPDGSHLDLSPSVASGQDSRLVMVVNVTILTDRTAGQNVQRKAGGDHTVHDFAAQREENHSVPMYIQDYAFRIVLFTASNNRLHYMWEVKETSRENIIIHKHFCWHQPLDYPSFPDLPPASLHLYPSMFNFGMSSSVKASLALSKGN